MFSSEGDTLFINLRYTPNCSAAVVPQELECLQNLGSQLLEAQEVFGELGRPRHLVSPLILCGFFDVIACISLALVRALVHFLMDIMGHMCARQAVFLVFISLVTTPPKLATVRTHELIDFTAKRRGP